MNLAIVCLLQLLQKIDGQILMKKFRFLANNLPNNIYKNIRFNVKSKIECAGYCNNDSLKCEFAKLIFLPPKPSKNRCFKAIFYQFQTKNWRFKAKNGHF